MSKKMTYEEFCFICRSSGCNPDLTAVLAVMISALEDQSNWCRTSGQKKMQEIYHHRAHELRKRLMQYLEENVYD